MSYDSFDVYYMTGNGFGNTLTLTASGGTPVIVNTNGSTGIGHTTVTAASAATTNTLTISAVGTNATVFVQAVEPWLSTSKHIRMGNVAIGGSTTTQWATDNASWGSIPSIKAYVPNLTIISLGINDAGLSTAASTVQANLAAIIAAAQVSGDVILMTMPPSQNTPYTTYEALYQPVYLFLAQSNSLPLINTYQRLGQGTWNTNWMYDALHPSSVGYWDMAGALYALISATQ